MIMIVLFIMFSVILMFLILYGIIPPGESPERRAGRIGEEMISHLIQDILTDDDFLLNNVRIEIDGNETELDNIIVNSYGIFIIEVKNYKGKLYGKEDDYEWTKIKVSEAGNSYQDNVKNPVKQVKRQVYILSRYLKDHGFHIWIDGYVFLVRGNSPINSPYILHSKKEIDQTIHRSSKLKIDRATRSKLIKVLLKS